MRWSLPAVACLLFFAGCTAPPDPTSSTTATSAFAVTAGTAPAPIEVLTDTMHLLEAPHAAATLVARAEVIRTPVDTTSAVNSPTEVVSVGPPRNVTYAMWDLPRPARMDFLTGTALLYVEFQGNTANSNPLDQCYWRVNLIAVRPDDGIPVGVSTGDGEVCLPQPDVLPTGIHELHVAFPGRPIPADAGDRLVLSLTSSATMTPGSSIVVLSGTPEHDSRITLNGLQVPLDIQTYA